MLKELDDFIPIGRVVREWKEVSLRTGHFVEYVVIGVSGFYFGSAISRHGLGFDGVESRLEDGGNIFKIYSVPSLLPHWCLKFTPDFEHTMPLGAIVANATNL
jgi:hypothetical protein